MEALNDFFNLLDSYLGSSAWFPYVLLGTGLFFTIYLKFPQLRYFKHALKVVTGKYEKSHHEGDTSHFQALTTALSGTVGTGNIGGVAFAIFLGGPAALFWMWATAFLGMCTKFVEVALSHKYREKASDGSISGGPMYFMKKRLNINLANGKVVKTGAFLGGFFAIATVISSFGTGNMPQINNIAAAMNATFGISQWITGVSLAIILALIIIGGIKRIAMVTEKLVPAMALIYMIGAFAVIVSNIDNILPSFVSIFSTILSGTAITGGFLGATFAFAFNRGVGRGLFSNEAGQGSAPIAHAAARADEPISEGIVAILEPFIDTIIICTITGLVVLSSNVWTKKFENTFSQSDLIVLSGHYSEEVESNKIAVSNFLKGMNEQNVQTFSGEIIVDNGKIIGEEFTFIHNRSFAEDITVTSKSSLFSGKLQIGDGRLNSAGVTLTGKSLVHSVVLTTEAFKKGLFGDFGQYIVSIGLLLFAFSTVISWSYYGDRAMTYLFGSSSVIYYRIVYIIGFIAATLVDTTVIWTIANVAIVIMTLPNLLGIFILRKEMKSSLNDYITKFNSENPNETPIS